MIVGISIGRGFDNISEIYKVLDAMKPTEVCSLKNDKIKTYCKDRHISYEEITIDWSNIIGAKNIKHNNYGKPYNADAPAEAAQKLVDYVDEIVEFGGGDFSISKFGKSKIVKQDKMVNLEKKYKF
jgi:hypothetical protein